MKKVTVLALLGLLFVPSMVSAAWWNPFTWKKSIPPAENTATTTDTTTLALPSVDELYKRIAELEAKLDAARAGLKVAAEVVMKVETKTVAPTPAASGVSDSDMRSKVRPAIVFVETATTSATGAVIDAQGRILTSARAIWIKDSTGAVAGASSEATIAFPNGVKKKAVLVGLDESADLAILQLTDKKASTYAALTYDSALAAGDKGYTFGFSSEQANTIGSFVPATVASKTSSSIQAVADIKPVESWSVMITSKGNIIGTQVTSTCKVLEEMKTCLKYNVTATTLSSARIQKLIGGMKLYKDKKNRTPEEALIRGFLDGMYSGVGQSGAVDYAINNATGKNSFDYFNDRLSDDLDYKMTKIYLNKLKTTSENLYQAFDLLKSLSYALRTSLINEDSAILKLDVYQQKIIRQVQADNEARLKDYQVKIDLWAKKKSEYDSYLLRLSDVTHDYLMAQGVSVETAAEYLKIDRQKLLDALSGETVNIY